MRIWLLVLSLVSAGADAHKPSDSFLSLAFESGRISGQWDIALRDLEDAVGLDGNDDGAISWGELRARREAVAAYALSRLGLAVGESACPSRWDDLLVDQHSDGAYAVLRFAAACPTDAGRLSVDYRLFFDRDPQHRGLLRLSVRGLTHTAVLGPAAPVFRPPLQAVRDPWREFLSYAREGVWHIWIGYDHILFLLSLLLPAVLVRERNGWRSAPRLKGVLWDAARIVTAFTLAHSVTLSLADLGYVAAPSRWTESAIAASVILAAVNNLYPVLHRCRAAVAFAFGLVHGLGFASVLEDLRLPGETQLTGLLGFNLGVEAGQLAIVAAFLPVAYRLSRLGLYVPVVLRAGSLGIALLAALWLAERGLDVRLFGL